MENLEQVKYKINLTQYIEQRFNLGKGTKTTTGTLYKNCPICKSTSNKNGDNGHFLINETTQSYSSFSNCCKGGDILNFIQETENKDFKEAKEKLYKLTNTPMQEYKPKISNEVATRKQENQSQEEAERIKKEQLEKQEFIKKQKKQFVLNGIKEITAESMQKVCDYMKKRGINKETVIKYNMFYSNSVYEDHNTGIERVVIPIYKNGEPISYVARAIGKVEGKPKAINSAGEQIPLNIDYLKQKPEKEKCIYICEGWADALSIEEQGKKAIALNSTQNKNKLLDAIKENIEKAKEYLYIIATDNDEAGQKVKVELQIELSKLNIKNTYLDIPKEYKDVNEWYCKVQRETFCDLLEQSIYNKYNDKTIDNYIGNYYLNEIKDFCRYPIKKTGFRNLDEQLGGGIKSGLYVIGAIPSLGKTTFTLQLADNIAKQGNKVIIFSLEQSRFELVSKAISRLTWEYKPRRCKNT